MYFLKKFSKDSQIFLDNMHVAVGYTKRQEFILNLERRNLKPE